MRRKGRQESRLADPTLFRSSACASDVDRACIGRLGGRHRQLGQCSVSTKVVPDLENFTFDNLHPTKPDIGALMPSQLRIVAVSLKIYVAVVLLVKYLLARFFSPTAFTAPRELIC
jgi:hypothetical protein